MGIAFVVFGVFGCEATPEPCTPGVASGGTWETEPSPVEDSFSGELARSESEGAYPHPRARRRPSIDFGAVGDWPLGAKGGSHSVPEWQKPFPREWTNPSGPPVVTPVFPYVPFVPYPGYPAYPGYAPNTGYVPSEPPAPPPATNEAPAPTDTAPADDTNAPPGSAPAAQ